MNVTPNVQREIKHGAVEGNMAGYSSRSDQLWQLAEEETNSIPSAQHEEHGQIIQMKYNQLASNLSCLGDITAMMYEGGKLTPLEFERINSLLSTPIRANEELLSVIARKPRDVFECFLSLVKNTNQPHLYQMLVSGDPDTGGQAKREYSSDHKDLICRNFMWLSEKMDTENGLLSQLYQQKVLTVREREDIFCSNSSYRRNECLLGVLSKKSPEDFTKFLYALVDTGQGHLAEKLTKLEVSHTDLAIRPSADSSSSTYVKHELQPKTLDASEKKSFPYRSISKPVLPPKTLPKPQQKDDPSQSGSKSSLPPKPDTWQTVQLEQPSRKTESIDITVVTEAALNSLDMFWLNPSDIVLTRELGGGTFGPVMLGEYRHNNRTVPVAVKTVNQSHLEAAKEEILTEARLMAKLNNSYIVRMIGVCRSECIMLVLELAPLGPLNKYLKKSPTTTVQNITMLMQQVSQGMGYLESHNIVHRNLAARNVLLANEHLAKISNFRMSKALGIGNEYYRAEAAGSWPLKWYAPECIYFYKFDSKSDVWSYGVTLWEAMSYGEKPYRGMKGAKIVEMIDEERRLDKPEKCPQDVYELMLRCWQRKSEDRPTFQQISLQMQSFL